MLYALKVKLDKVRLYDIVIIVVAVNTLII